MAHTLLLADDSITIQRVIELTFAEQEIRVIMVSDGEQAIERLKTERPDIVLVAVALPKRDGYEVARFVQRLPALRGVPVVLLIGAFDTVDDARVRESGVADVLIKPFEPGLVINRVKELLGMSTKTAVRPGAPPVPPGRSITTSEVPDERRVARPPMHEPAFAPPRAAVPVAEPEHRPAPAEPLLDQLRDAKGLASQTSNVESGATGGGEAYFEQLDAAFDTLDAQLTGRRGPQGGSPTTAPKPHMPAAIDPGRRPSAPASERYVEPVAPVELRTAVFEVDAEWFGAVGAPGTEAEGAEGAEHAVPAPQHYTPPPVLDAPAYEPSPYPSPVQQLTIHQPVYQAPVSEAPASEAPAYEAPAYQPPAVARHAQPAAVAALKASSESAVADAFAALLAEEQGEPPPPQVESPGSFDLSDDAIERIAARVADRLTQGLLGETVSRVVTEVSERLVREEIARIRAAASQLRQ